MDRKKVKIVLTVCFVVISGVVSLGICYGTQGKGKLVLEKTKEQRSVEEQTGREVQTADAQSGATSVGTDAKQLSANEEMLYVHICGAVENEGVYALSVGSRLMDGVKAAGGFTEEADTSYHNLAALLLDGQKVYVPTLTETKELSVAERADDGMAAETGQPGGSKAVEGENDRVNLNTAGKEELMSLNGIGEAKAESILAYRQKVGPFQSAEELKKVSGIGDALFERVKNSIKVE